MKIKKILLLAVPMLTLSSGALLLGVNHAQAVKAEEVALTEEEKQTESKIKEFKDTILIPLLSGVSITAVFSFVASVGFSVFNSKVNRKTRKIAEGCIEQTIATLSLLRTLTKEFEENKELSKETLKTIDESFKKLLDQLGKLEEATEKAEKVKEAIILIGEMQKELAKVDRQVVSSGVTKSLVELEAKLKELE